MTCCILRCVCSQLWLFSEVHFLLIDSGREQSLPKDHYLWGLGIARGVGTKILQNSQTLRIIGPSKLAILRTLPLRHIGSFTLPLEGPWDP